MTEDQERETTPDVAVPREAINVERHDGPVKLRLLDSALWQAFRQEGTEMIITKAGRRMFPFVMVTLEGLSPTLLYSLHLSLVPCDSRQYKFCQRRWVSVSDTAPGPTPVPDTSYIHPASPNRGTFWCQEMISFAKMKITNNKHSQGDVVLQSMRKYMAQITVREDLGDQQYVFPLPETTFVAVTQYQNEAVTRMKIAHNPFANGFKYAHVTGSEDGKIVFPRTDILRSRDSRQKYPSSSSSNSKATKAARFKSTTQTQSGERKAAQNHHDVTLAGFNSPVPLNLTQPFQPLQQQSLPRAEDTTCQHTLHQLAHEARLAAMNHSFTAVPTNALAYMFHPEAETKAEADDDVSVDFDDSEADLKERCSFSSSSPSCDPGDKCRHDDASNKSSSENSNVGHSSHSEKLPHCYDTQHAVSSEEDEEGDEIRNEKKDEAEEEEDKDCDTDATTTKKENMSPRDSDTSSSIIPTTVTEADGEGSTEPALHQSEDTNVSDQNVSFSTCRLPVPPHSLLSQRSAQLSLAASTDNQVVRKKSEMFKQPLPKRTVVITNGKKNSGRSSFHSPSSSVLRGTTDLDFLWYRNALRQASERQGDISVKTDRGVHLKLHDTHTWHSFAACGSKMAVNQMGRPIFPVITVSLRGLDHDRLYSVWLHLTAADDITSSSYEKELGARGPAGNMQLSSPPVRPYMHPCSPMRGLAWMKVKITFNDVKLTSDMASDDVSSLPVSDGRRYLTQVVVREEEVVNPGSQSSPGDLLFFPLPEVTFTANTDTDDVESTLPIIPAAPRLTYHRKRRGATTYNSLQDDVEDSEDTALPLPAKLSVGEGGASPWMTKTPAQLPHSADLSAITSRPIDLSAVMDSPSADLSAILPRHADMSGMVIRPSELANRLNSLYCFPPVSNLPPAHLGLLANRMPVSSSLPSLASFPAYTPPLFPHLRTPMHSAFGMALPPFNPFPYVYYPYAMPSVAAPPTGSPVGPEASKGLDLSLKSSEAR